MLLTGGVLPAALIYGAQNWKLRLKHSNDLDKKKKVSLGSLHMKKTKGIRRHNVIFLQFPDS